MRKTYIVLLIAVILVPILLVSEVNYLSEDEYKKLKKAERESYWQRLESDLQGYQQRKSDANARAEAARSKLEEVNQQITAVDSEHEALYDSILEYLQIDKSDRSIWSGVEERLAYFNSAINSFNSLSDSELWEAKKRIYALKEEWHDYRAENASKIPDFQDDVNLIENRITRLVDEMESKRPKYYEDTYTVVRGESLSKISGYHFIYNDPSLWGIIYRANRDQIKDPNLIYPDQVLKIPRGKPNTWKVYKGEFLWKIASYPEVYGNGAKWPRIYRANQDQIKDPDLIYPNQVFEIPRD